MLRGLAALALVASAPAYAAPRMLRGDRFAIAVPEGYDDVTQQVRESGFPRPQMTLMAQKPTNGFQAVISFQRVPVYGGSLGDERMCNQSGRNMASEGKGKLKSAVIIAGPSGPSCQLHVVYPEAIALMTDFTGARETWLMTCNHADGDTEAEAACRATLASIQLAPDFGRPAPVRMWEVYLNRILLEYWALSHDAP